jgi:hypothetical protein
VKQFDDALKLVDAIRMTYSREPRIDEIVGQLRGRIMAEKFAAQNKDSVISCGPAKGK